MSPFSFMMLGDISLPLDPGLPTHPGGTPCGLEAVGAGGASARVLTRRR